MAETIIDSLYNEFTDLLKFLDDAKEISLRSTVDTTFKKTLALSAASYFEDELRNLLLRFVDEKSNSNELLINLVRNKAIARQYHTFFDWRGKNANSFFSLFGDEFRQSAIEDVKEDDELGESIKAFLDLGNTRNELAHLNFANMELNKTAEEVYGQFKNAQRFLEYIGKKLNEFNKNGESGKERLFSSPPHTTLHAGPHRAVHEDYRAVAG